MIFGVQAADLVPLLNILGLGFLGVVAAFGVWFGRKRGSPDAAVEVAGALVDSNSIKLLTAAIEAHSMHLIALRQDNEKARAVAHRIADGLVGLDSEIAELRRAAADVANQIARMK